MLVSIIWKGGGGEGLNALMRIQAYSFLCSHMRKDILMVQLYQVNTASLDLL